ncbi:MAG: VanZ family protein [Phycisphaerae bacterium]
MNRLRLRRPGLRARRAILGAYTIFLVSLTHLPRTAAAAIPIQVWDKAAHASAYAVLGFLAIWSFGGACGSWRMRRWAVTFAALAVFAVLDEITQPLVGRHTELLDGVADILGVAIGMPVSAWWNMRQRQGF